jgi:rubredoxin
MTWVIVVWCVLVLVWAIVGGAHAASGCHTQSLVYNDGCQTGTGIGVALVLFVGFVGFVVLSLIWFMTGRGNRDCPVCGRGAKRGKTVCPSCGHDFAVAAGVPPHSVSPGS